jgi:hypothetical protein
VALPKPVAGDFGLGVHFRADHGPPMRGPGQPPGQRELHGRRIAVRAAEKQRTDEPSEDQPDALMTMAASPINRMAIAPPPLCRGGCGMPRLSGDGM